MQKDKKGISLIVLAITIIVMIILAGTVIITLMNQDIIERAETTVNNLDVAEVQSLAELKWSDAYIAGKRTKEELTQAVIDGLEKELGKEVVAKYSIVANDEGVDVFGSTWIEDIIDTVPIPKGFVASSVEGENTKNGGLVIYEGTEAVNDGNHYEALRTRNQYVWVPVEDFSKFVRQNFGSSNTISNTLGTAGENWEVALDEVTKMPLPSQDMNYMTATTLEEVIEMYESVKQYKGFYIARYEAGIDSQRIEKGNAADLPGIKEGTRVYSVMGKIPYNYIPWTGSRSMSEDTNGAVEVARRMYPNDTTNTTGVVSTLIYSVQWDRTLAWWLEVGAKDGKGNVITSLTDSKSYGNYENSRINEGDLNDGAKYAVCSWSYELGSYTEATSSSTKASGRAWALTTGALRAAKVNNIYDMAGNMDEWSMEGYREDCRVGRGGSLSYNSQSSKVNLRAVHSPDSKGSRTGFRPCLYIKK